MRYLKWVLAVLAAIAVALLARAGYQTFASARQQLNTLDRETERLRARELMERAKGEAYEEQAKQVRLDLAYAIARRHNLVSEWAATHDGQDLASLVSDYNREAP